MDTPEKIAQLDFRGKTAVVTGTTNGLGLAISEEFVKRNISTLIMGVRNVRKGEEIKADLLARPELRAVNPGVLIHVVELQMGDFKSDKAFADQVKELTETVDILLLNAGVGGVDFETAESGHEKIMQVNVYSNALLALELLPLLEHTARVKSQPSRLTWVGSFVQLDNSLTKKPMPSTGSVVAYFDNKSNFNGLARYPDSKLMGTVFVKQLAKRIDKNLVIFNEACPGQVLTNFGASYPAYLRAVFAVIGAFKSKSKSLAEGVNKYLFAIAVAGDESHGEYISDYRIAQRAAIVFTPQGEKLQKAFFAEVMGECRKTNTSLPTW